MNESENYTHLGLSLPHWQGELRFSSGVEILLTVLYILITTTALFLNSMVCYLFISHRLKRTPFHEYLLNLTLSDILSVLGLYPYIFAEVRKYNLSPEVANYLCSFTDGMTVYWICTAASVCILCLISFNRYLVINHPRRLIFLRRKLFVQVSVLISWLFSLLFMLPNVFSYRFDNEAQICVRHWPKRFDGNIFTYISVAIGIGIPIICMVYSLFATVRTLWFKTRLNTKKGAVIQARKRVVLMLVTLICAFVICWFPFAIYWLIAGSGAVFASGTEGDYQKHRIIRIVILFAALNPVLDPIIYGLRSFEIGRAFKSLLVGRASVFITRSFRSHSDHDSQHSPYKLSQSQRTCSNETVIQSEDQCASTV